MKKYNYFGRVSGWGICMLFLLTGLFAGCSENEEDYRRDKDLLALSRLER